MNKVTIPLLTLGLGMLFASWDVCSQTGFLTGQATSGMTKICYYNVLGSTYAQTFSNVTVCPVTINSNLSPQVNTRPSQSGLHPYVNPGRVNGADNVLKSMQSMQNLQSIQQQNQLLELQIQNQQMQLEQTRRNLIEQDRNKTAYPATTYTAPAYKEPTPLRPETQIEEDSRPQVRHITIGNSGNVSSKKQTSQVNSSSSLRETGKQASGTVEGQSVDSQEISKVTEHRLDGMRITCTTTGNVTECK